MALRASPFPNGFVAGIHAVGWAFILPCFWFLDRLISVCKTTTLERSQRLEQECYLHPLKVFFGSIIFFILFLIAAPFAFLGFLLWAPLQACRRPFSYHRETPSSPEMETHTGFELVGKASFGFATANLCLLPDSLARFNNLGHTQRRATAIGRRIVQGVCRPHIRIFVDSPSSCGTLSPSNSILPTGHPCTYGATDKQDHHSDSAEVSVPNSNSHVVCVPCNDTEEPSTEAPTPVLNSNQNSNQEGRAGEGEIRCEQLNMVTKWTGDFQAANKQPDEDVVFDVLCGDFNFDNCSPDDNLEQNHCLFEEYRDPCRAGPRQEKPWVIGTLLEQPTLYEDDVNTPEKLQRTLEREELRKRYISPPVPVEGIPLVYPENGEPWIGRRIDYILYRESSISKHCQTEIEEMTFITQLAGLTDHIPVGLRLNVTLDSDRAEE
ncbi:Sphingomyelin phosphodiesterase 5 [Larimichthys crocea]|uniref:Uncharacterized protein n=1 Tax=Larimichthys crocea TaxID=215358 RepID=A0ACD3QUT9_LARCR|nr:Sphingomyelin phosphodiesterase 5 [Larimichthys crocea]